MGDVTLEIKLKNVKDKTDKIDINSPEPDYVLTYDIDTDTFTPKPPQGGDIDVDSELSLDSENPVQNKVITTVINLLKAITDKFNLENSTDGDVLVYDGDSEQYIATDKIEKSSTADALNVENKDSTFGLSVARNGRFDSDLLQFINKTGDNYMFGADFANESYISKHLNYFKKGIITISEGTNIVLSINNVIEPVMSGMWLLFTYEYTISTKAYRGHHIYCFITPIVNNTPVQQINVAASGNAGLTINRPNIQIHAELPYITLKPSSTAYGVVYALYYVRGLEKA